jgi:hypothetical protein
MTRSNPEATLHFHVPSRFTVVRDLAMVAFLALVCGGFLASAWSGPAPSAAGAAAAPTVVAGR